MTNYIIVYGLSIAGLVFLLFCCSSIIFSVLSFAPWVPSRSRDLARIFKLADLKEGQVFYDLGCGDGKVVIYAAKHYKVQSIGLEISLPLYLFCRFRQLLEKNGKVIFKLKNLFKENLSSADVVYFFGIPSSLNEAFSAKLKKELKPGAKVISYAFKLHNWTPEIVDKPSNKDLPINLYIV